MVWDHLVGVEILVDGLRTCACTWSWCYGLSEAIWPKMQYQVMVCDHLLPPGDMSWSETIWQEMGYHIMGWDHLHVIKFEMMVRDHHLAGNDVSGEGLRPPGWDLALTGLSETIWQVLGLDRDGLRPSILSWDIMWWSEIILHVLGLDGIVWNHLAGVEISGGGLRPSACTTWR